MFNSFGDKGKPKPVSDEELLKQEESLHQFAKYVVEDINNLKSFDDNPAGQKNNNAFYKVSQEIYNTLNPRPSVSDKLSVLFTKLYQLTCSQESEPKKIQDENQQDVQEKILNHIKKLRTKIFSLRKKGVGGKIVKYLEKVIILELKLNDALAKKNNSAYLNQVWPNKKVVQEFFEYIQQALTNNNSRSTVVDETTLTKVEQDIEEVKNITLEVAKFQKGQVSKWSLMGWRIAGYGLLGSMMVRRSPKPAIAALSPILCMVAMVCIVGVVANVLIQHCKFKKEYNQKEYNQYVSKLEDISADLIKICDNRIQNYDSIYNDKDKDNNIQMNHES